jgi:hypothetical protein
MITSDLSGVVWDNLRSVVMADYRPGGTSGAYDMLQAVVPYTAAFDVTTTALFPQVAIGGGYTTVLTFVNTGSTTMNGQLILTDRNGNPWAASFSEPAPSEAHPLSEGRALSIAPFTTVSIPPGGTQQVIASASVGSAMTGWARVESSGGVLGGVATYYFAPTGKTETIVGVLSSSPVSSATIPRDDDVSQSRYTGFAVANPSDQTITIQVLEVAADGTTVNPLSPIVLASRAQKAAFFFEDSRASQKFRGTAVLVGQSGAAFSVVSLALNNGIYTSIPVVPGCSPSLVK